LKKELGAVILAAGEGKRLKLNKPKPLAPCLDQCLVDFPIQELSKFFTQINLKADEAQITAVVGHRKEEVIHYLSAKYQKLTFATQEQQLGTGDALRAYFNSQENAKNFQYTFILCADTPVVRSSVLYKMYQHAQAEKLDGVAASFRENQPAGYGRILRNPSDASFKIVEEKDASASEKAITEVNSGMYLVKTQFLIEQLKKINAQNNSNEFYLTDIFQWGEKVQALLFNEAQYFLGVNTLKQLEHAENALNQVLIDEHRENGVRFIQSATVRIDSQVEIGAGTVIYPQVSLRGRTKIGENCTIDQGAIIKSSELSAQVKVHAYSVLEEARVLSQAEVGPFARLRPQTHLKEKVKIGNFVEIKKSVLDAGVKVSHLSYVGDAFIGEETNIGCGFITCNYDGAQKHVTKIGKHCFIGSDSQTVAPVEIGDDCFVASSSTITKNMPSGSFAISRSPQITKENLAHRFIKKKKD